MRKQLAALGVAEEAATRILAVMACRSIEELQGALGPSEAVDELQLLFQLAEGYGYGSWLEYDASVVRGLAYYTGAPLLLCAQARRCAWRCSACGSGASFLWRESCMWRGWLLQMLGWKVRESCVGRARQRWPRPGRRNADVSVQMRCVLVGWSCWAVPDAVLRLSSAVCGYDTELGLAGRLSWRMYSGRSWYIADAAVYCSWGWTRCGSVGHCVWDTVAGLMSVWLAGSWGGSESEGECRHGV